MHGAGNDFVVIDDRGLGFPSRNKVFVKAIASRRTGIGCDGILLVQPSNLADIRMRFINPDGNEVDMCGNGARCIARFAFDCKIALGQMTIETNAGLVMAEVMQDIVRLNLTDPVDLQFGLDVGMEWSVDFVNTGVPHAVAWVDDLKAVDLAHYGRMIRMHDLFAPEGTNANFVQAENDGSLAIRTYERGVEAETLACGTGAAAAAVLAVEKGVANFPVTAHCAGGHDLIIDSVQGTVTLAGGAAYVYAGEVEYGNRV